MICTFLDICTYPLQLKGAGGSKLIDEVRETAIEVGLEAKIFAPSSSLSGGQKRKLSVGIALIGGSKVKSIFPFFFFLN